MTDQLQVATEWLGDLNNLLSKRQSKESYDYGKKRTDALEWLIQQAERAEKNAQDLEDMDRQLASEQKRVEDLESAIATGQHVSNLMLMKIVRYKQALEFYADDESWTLYDHHGRTQLGLDGGRKARQALKGESE